MFQIHEIQVLVGFTTQETGSACRSLLNAPSGAWYGTIPFNTSVLALTTLQDKNLSNA